jgi:hypothetical protein
MKTLSEIRLEIDPEKYYSPREISQKCWITNSNGEEAKTNYDQVLRLIRFGKLPARNFGLGKTPYYRVKGIDLLNYLKTF